MRNPEVYLKEYCQRLSDDNLRFLATKLGQRLNGDLGDSLEYLSKVREIDKWLSSASNYNELYDMIDLISSFVLKEANNRLSD